MSTRKETIIAMLAELIETHMEKCAPNEGEHYFDSVPHVVSEKYGTKADIQSVDTSPNSLMLKLSDGTKWTIAISGDE